MKRRAFISMLAAGALSGCRSRGASEALQIAFAPAAFSDMYRALADAFMKHHPGRRVNLLPAPNTEDLMQRNFRLALVRNLPDVSHDGLNMIRFYVERGLPVALNGFLAKDRVAIRALGGSYGGQQYALPFAVSVPVFYYNRALVRRAGGEPFPATWPGVLALAARIRDRNDKAQGIFVDYQAGSALAWQTLVFSRGGSMMSADERRVLFDGPEGLWAATVLRDLGRAGQIDMSRESARRSFAAGTLGIYQNTSSHLRNFLLQQQGDALGVAPVPVDPVRGRVPASGSAVMMLTKEPARQAAAWEYLRFATGPIGQTIMARHTGYLSSSSEALERSDLLGEFLERNPLYRVPYGELPRLTAWYAFPGPRSLRIAEQIQEVMRTLLVGRTSPVAALARMRTETEKLLPRSSAAPLSLPKD